MGRGYRNFISMNGSGGRHRPVSTVRRIIRPYFHQNIPRNPFLHKPGNRRKGEIPDRISPMLRRYSLHLLRCTGTLHTYSFPFPSTDTRFLSGKELLHQPAHHAAILPRRMQSSFPVRAAVRRVHTACLSLHIAAT